MNLSVSPFSILDGFGFSLFCWDLMKMHSPECHEEIEKEKKLMRKFYSRLAVSFLAASLIVSGPAMPLFAADAQTTDVAYNTQSLLDSAMICRKFSGSDRVFDGTRAVNLIEGKTDEEISLLKNSDSGTVVITFRSSAAGPYTLLNAHVPDAHASLGGEGLANAAGSEQLNLYINNLNQIRTDWAGLFGTVRASSVSQNAWHTIVLSQKKVGGSWRFTMDGQMFVNGSTNAAGNGFFNRLSTNPAELLVGGARCRQQRDRRSERRDRQRLHLQ